MYSWPKWVFFTLGSLLIQSNPNFHSKKMRVPHWLSFYPVVVDNNKSEIHCLKTWFYFQIFIIFNIADSLKRNFEGFCAVANLVWTGRKCLLWTACQLVLLLFHLHLYNHLRLLRDCPNYCIVEKVIHFLKVHNLCPFIAIFNLSL